MFFNNVQQNYNCSKRKIFKLNQSILSSFKVVLLNSILTITLIFNKKIQINKTGSEARFTLLIYHYKTA